MEKLLQSFRPVLCLYHQSPVGLSPFEPPYPASEEHNAIHPTPSPHNRVESEQIWLGNHISRYEAINQSLHKFGVSNGDRVSEQQLLSIFSDVASR